MGGRDEVFAFSRSDSRPHETMQMPMGAVGAFPTSESLVASCAFRQRLPELCRGWGTADP